MKILFLGTAAAEAYPGLYCNCDKCQRARALGGNNLRCRSSVLVNDDLLIDHGPDTPAQCVRFGVDMTAIRDFLFTHSHSDHLHVFDMWYRHVGSRKRGQLSVSTAWGNRQSIEKFNDQACAAIAENFLDSSEFVQPTKEELLEEIEGLLLLKAEVIQPRQSIVIGRYTVHSIDAKHKEPEDTMNFIIDDGKRPFLYGADTGPWPPSEWAYIESLGLQMDLIALDCTVGDASPGGHHSNTSFLEVRREFEARGLLSPEARFFAHHFSHQSNYVHEDLVTYMEPHGVEVTYDGLSVELHS